MNLPDFKVRPLTPFEMEAGYIFFVLFFVLLFAWMAWDALKRKVDRRRQLLHLVSEHAAKTELTHEEAELLERITLAEGIFPGLRTFEREVDLLLQQGESADTIHRLRFKLGFNIPKSGHRLFSTRECEPGQDVTISIGSHVWKGSIFTVDERFLTLRIPDDAARTLVKPGAEIKVGFWRNFDAHYHFRTNVREQETHPLALIHIDHPQSMDRRQDRESFRAEIHWEAKVVKVNRVFGNSGPGTAIPSGDPLSVTVVDLSEGGARFLPIPGIREDDELIVSIPMADRAHPLRAPARVISAGKDDIRCRFENLSMHEKDEIHRQILKLTTQGHALP
ncbi:MAG: PilZ domain-containing protein [Candidatus Hydrogenedentota bacterium]